MLIIYSIADENDGAPPGLDSINGGLDGRIVPGAVLRHYGEPGAGISVLRRSHVIGRIAAAIRELANVSNRVLFGELGLIGRDLSAEDSYFRFLSV